MIIPDINLLIYAHISSMPQHVAARAWWEGAIRSGEPIGLAWATLVGFVRITTSRHILPEPLTVAEALTITDEWLDSPVVHTVEPGRQHYQLFSRLVRETPGGNLTTDAHLAALAIEHNAELHSNDYDFGRFSGVRWVNPLAKA